MKKVLGPRLALLPAVLVLAGTLQAGNLEPPGPPGPTMKTLDEIPPTWSQLLPAADRFQPVMQFQAAVLDRETGLVWQRQPIASNTMGWNLAVSTCWGKADGGRFGWRLPTGEELLSLRDPAESTAPFLPPGHPFLFVGTPGRFWTASSASPGGGLALAIDFSTSSPQIFLGTTDTTPAVWCVRGGQGSGAHGP